jgi:hypothetical protein
VTEEKKRAWDVALGIAGPVVAVLGLLLGVWQFNKGEENKTKLESHLLQERDSLEYRRKLLDQRLATYHTIADLAGKIAAHGRHDKIFEGFTESFLAQYWGLMILVQDQGVETSMIRFHDEIADYQKHRSDINRVRIRADELVKACRASLARERSASGL